MDEKIFKAYDIRGVYPEELDEDSAYKVGRAFVKFLGCREVVVGQDMRKSSPGLFSALAEGITDQGADVIDVGACSTPMFYFCAHGYPAGVMVTASHNPARYNGFKFVRDGTVPISGDTGIMDIKRLVIDGSFEDPVSKGSIRKIDMMPDFIAHNIRFLEKGDRPLKIVIDTGNGMGGFTYPKVFAQVSDIEVIPLYFDVDMSFPNHEADPLKLENIKDLQAKVVEVNADFGVAVDGDCDRCFFVDERGERISADMTTALLAEVLLKEHPGSHILYDLRSSWVTKEVIEANGGTCNVCRVGHAFIKEQMRREKALFAGELSGHLYYRDSFTTESSIISTFMIINLLRRENRPLSELVAPLRKYFASGEINSRVSDPQGIMQKLEDIYKTGAKSVSHLDGIKMEFDDWWFNVRASNTEPLLRLNLEAKTKERMEEMRDKVLEVIRS